MAQRIQPDIIQYPSNFIQQTSNQYVCVFIHLFHMHCSTRWGFTINGFDKNDIFIDELPKEEEEKTHQPTNNTLHIFIRIICHF